MNLTKKILVKNLEHDRSIIERLVEENVTGKLDSYLRRYKEWTVCNLAVNVSGNKKGNFSGSITLDADGAVYRSERDDYKNLDDLVNHLFDHIKEQLSKAGKGKSRSFLTRLFTREA